MTGAEVGRDCCNCDWSSGVAGWRGEVWVGLALNLGRAEVRPYIYFGEWGRNATASEGRLYNLLDLGGRTLG